MNLARNNWSTFSLYQCINPLPLRRLRLLLLRLFLVFFSSSTFSRSNPPCTHSLTHTADARARM